MLWAYYSSFGHSVDNSIIPKKVLDFLYFLVDIIYVVGNKPDTNEGNNMNQLISETKLATICVVIIVLFLVMMYIIN